MATTREELDAAWAEWLKERNSQNKLTQGATWRRDNPGEWTQLQAYRAGGPRPSLASITGKQMVYETAAWLSTGSVPPPPPPPPPNSRTPVPPQGTMTVRDGGGTVDKFSDCWTHTASPFTVSNKHVKNVKWAGVGSQQTWPPNVANPGRTTITDCIVENVGTGGSQGGTGEANAWLGNPTTMQRCILRDSDWMLVNLVARSHGSLLEDLLLEDAPVGVYFELATHDVTLRRVSTKNIAPRSVAGGDEPLDILAARSHTMEWWHRFPEYGGVTGPYNITFDACDIYCPPRDPRFLSGPSGFDPSAGVYIGPGCYGIRFINSCRFWGPGWAVYAPNIRANNGADVFFSADTVFEQAGPNLSKHSLQMGT